MREDSSLRAFAARTIQLNSSLQFPFSDRPESLLDRFVEPRITDTKGTTLALARLGASGSRLALVGDAGSGKTTLLKYLAVTGSEAFLAGESTPLPVYIPLRALASPAGPGLNSQIAANLPADQSGPLLVLLDGLDEAPNDVRGRLLGEIAELSEHNSTWTILLSSRPGGLWPPLPDGFQYVHLSILDASQSWAIISRLDGPTELVSSFEQVLRSHAFLEGLSRNPLLIGLLWQVYRVNRHLPQGRADLFQTVCDFLLSSWDAARMVMRPPHQLHIGAVHGILGIIATKALAQSTFVVHAADVRRTITDAISPESSDVSSVDSLQRQLMSSGILVMKSADVVSFVHMSFLEFYAARHLACTASPIPGPLADSPHAREVILFAAGLMVDVAPLIESAVNRHDLILAAACLREGRTDNRSLEAYVLDGLRRELGADVVRRLADGLVAATSPEPESIHAVLSRQYAEVRNVGLDSHEKGRRFEEFARSLFSETFRVVECDLRTENGEIDLILENIGSDPFWLEYGGDILVECKNWDRSRPLKETAAFANKVRLCRGRLGFFVSVSGFTDDAIRTLRNQVADRDAPLIVPISGQDIDGLLQRREKVPIFFKGAVRKMKHLHKW